MKADWLLTLGLAACAAGAAHAAAPDQESREVDNLVMEFGVYEEEVEALREKAMGWGEIRHALTLSRESDRPLSEIVALREQGMGWGQVAKEVGYSPQKRKQKKEEEREKLTDALGPVREPQVGELAEEFAVSRAEVRAMRAEGMNWGEIRYALTVARQSGKPVSEIMSLRERAMGRGKEGGEPGLKPIEINKGGLKKPVPRKGGGRKL